MNQHPYYHTCPYCGDNNDPGEICDCQKDKRRETDTITIQSEEANEKDERE